MSITAIERCVMVDQIDIFRGGLVGVRMKKLAILADGTVRWGGHRTSISPLEDAEERLAAVSEHLAAMRLGTLAREEWEHVLRTCARVHDKAAAEAFTERARKLEMGEDPDATLDGAVVFNQTSIFHTTPGCPPDRIDALILARPVQILAGLEPEPVANSDASLLRLLPGADLTAEREAFETKLGAERSPDEAQWAATGATAEAEHTPDVVARFAAEAPGLVERGVLTRADGDALRLAPASPRGGAG